MIGYVLRRLIQAVLVLVASSYLVYVLAAYAGDPLDDLRTTRGANREALMARRIEMLNLDTPPLLRYFSWLKGAVGCAVPGAMRCDLGKDLKGYEVTGLLQHAIVQTVLLVSAATVLAIVIGIALGIISALRQYTVLDYGVTFMAFLFFSLPVFWVAVLLKEFGAIRFNDFLRDPRFGPVAITGVVLMVAAGAWFASYGQRHKRALITVGAGAVTAAAMVTASLSGWLLAPRMGIIGIALVGSLAALALTYLSAGLRNRRALWSALTVVAAAVVLYYPLQPVLDDSTTWLRLFLLAILTIVVGGLIGWLWGGWDRQQNVRTAALTALAVASLIVADRFMQVWPAYIAHGRIRGRPIPTVNAQTPGFNEGFWLSMTDTVTHLLLPTMALMLIALASYSRYSRASMLEIMNMDYIRTARAKGVPERSVVMRHAFRNALIPLATIIAFDIGALIGGAVITETVFAFKGMGLLFVDSLRMVDLNPIMGVYLATGLMAMVFNLVADLLYAVLDPRVRVKA